MNVSDMDSRIVLLVTRDKHKKFSVKSVTKQSLFNGFITLSFSRSPDNKLDSILLEKLLNHKIDLLSITTLNLTGCSLSNLPDNFCALESLKELNLSHNKFEQVPECLEIGLKRIETLDLSYNLINDFEIEPKCYKKLTILRLNNNCLLNIPEWILYVRCYNLEEFLYSFNRVNQLAASRFDMNLNYNLKKLALISCSVIDEDLKSICSVRTLQELDLSNDKNKIATSNCINCDKLLESPKFSCSLRILKLHNLGISLISENISCLINLRELYLTNNQLVWLPDSITALESLEVLDVSYNSISYLPNKLEQLRSLRKLVLQYNCLCDIPDITCLNNLRYIDLYSNDLNEFNFEIESYDSIDVEMNNFNASELLSHCEYIKKKNKLRIEVPVERDDGYNTPGKSDHSSESDSASDYGEESEEELKLTTANEEEEEWWDGPYVSDYVRVCTLSDDEWLGCDKIPVKEKRSSKVLYEELFIFDDADE